MKHLMFLTLLVSLAFNAAAQIVSIDPAFPSRSEEITITYDATQGSAGLVGEQQVYMHTGLITNQSNGPSDWKHVVGNWGTDDSRVKMTSIGDDKHQLTMIIDDFYDITDDVAIEKLAYVFRNVNGSKEGKTETGGDIFLDFNDNPGFSTQLISPNQDVVIAEQGEEIQIKLAASEIAQIEVSDNGQVIYQEETDFLDFTYTVTDAEEHLISIVSSFDGEVRTNNLTIIVSPEQQIEEVPTGMKLGINKTSASTYTLVLQAPLKENVYVIGDFTDWKPSQDYFMKKSPDGSTFWLSIEVPEGQHNYAFQYLIDGRLQLADPFSEVVLDPNNDQWVDQANIPYEGGYPEGGKGYVSLLNNGSEDFEFEHDFAPPANTDLVIYELLLRDFLEEHDFNTLLDTIDYLDRLGINAIEFMPVNEFEGNDSWGYNPSFHMALDKYYGSTFDFKRLVDECHKRGMAVILDVVYNHAFSQSPLAQMYWDPASFRPTPESPYLNVVARHPFNVGYDFNHESQYTQNFVNRVTTYWLEEYNIDGFRFDLSKGFTQKQSTNDGQFRAYDQERIDVLKSYADQIWNINDEAYIILEHFAANNEEKELAEYGMMLWSNHTHNYNEATMGYNNGNNSNFEWIDYREKGWDTPHAVGYMESHDEERLMYKNIQFGNSQGSYSTRDIATGLQRVEMATAFFYTIPGPKMLWQFGEMGYDFSINRCTNGTISEDCRLSPKPIRWDYKEDLNRKRLLDVTSALIKLKTDTDVINTTSYIHKLSGAEKYIKLNGDVDALVVGNFDVQSQVLTPGWLHTGTWYDYLSGDSVEVLSTTQSIPLEAGEYHVYVDQDISTAVISGVEDKYGFIEDYQLFPNPAQDQARLRIQLQFSADASVSIIDELGRIIYTKEVSLQGGNNEVSLDLLNFNNGLYHVLIDGRDFRLVDRLLVFR